MRREDPELSGAVSLSFSIRSCEKKRGGAMQFAPNSLASLRAAIGFLISSPASLCGPMSGICALLVVGPSCLGYAETSFGKRQTETCNGESSDLATQYLLSIAVVET